MSLYNALFGENPTSNILLGMLGLNKEYFDRYRDIELIEGGTKIRVFTRLGGGNREYYTGTWEKIQSHELYIEDYDDDFDCTYAYIEYKIPKKYKETAKKMFNGEPISLFAKFNKELEDMDKEGTEANKKAKQIATQIEEAINNSNNNDDDNIHIIGI